MNVTITQLPVAGPITGTELVPVVQDGQTRQSTAAAIAASPAQFQTFLTLNQEPTLPNSRRLAVGTGLGLADGGALSTLSLSLNGASGALETASTGIVAKTGSATVVARTLTVSGLGMSITNGGGVAGNPTFALTGMVSDLANVSSPGLLASNGTGLNPRVLLGTVNEIDVTNGTGSAGNPTVGLADNPVVPGVASMVLPQGTTAQRAAPGFGAIRYNNETKNIEAYTELIGWGAIISGAGISTFSAGATGLSPSTPQTGNIVLSGVLLPANGGTGVSNAHTITLGGAVSTAGSFTTSGAAVTLTATGATNVTLPTTGTLATLAGSEVLTNKSISGSTNTLSNIGNGSLTNSSVTFNGTTVALGSSGTITANTTNALTVGTGLQLDSGTTFNGSAARTISLTSPVAVSLGGTGLTSYAAGDITYASAATTLTKLPLGTAGHVLIAGATAPQWGRLTAEHSEDTNMAQAGFTPIQLYRTTTASAVPTAGNLAAGELAINLTDKKLYAKDASNNVFLLADASSGGTTAANLAGGAAGSLPYQTGANATTFLGIGAANRVLTSSGTAPQWVTSLTGLTGVSSSSITNTSLTPTRLVYSTTGGAQTDSANLTFDGTSLTLGGNPTLSAGTANGVLYLNGSKVATSGSALTFDGTTLSSVGSGDRARFGTGSRNIFIAGDSGGVSLFDGAGQTGNGWYINGASNFVAGYIGSSEQMRLTSTGLGIGTSSPGSKLGVAGNAVFSGTAPFIAFAANHSGATPGYIQYTNSTNLMEVLSTGDIAFETGGSVTPKMRLDSSGNLGIGTSSPDGLLTLYTGSTFNARTSGINVHRPGSFGQYASIAYNGDATYFSSTYTGGGAGVYGQFLWQAYDSTSTPLLRMQLDSSGNLGLGVTPSAWGNSYKALQIPSGALAAYSTSVVSLYQNGYDSGVGAFKYVNSLQAAKYDINQGAHYWYIAPSGTAGNAISFTQAMTLDASGNLLVGTTTGYRNGRLVVKDVNRTQTSTLANLHVSTTDSQAADLGGSIGLGGQIGGDEAPLGLISGRKENSTSGNYAGYLAFATSDSSAAIAERARITSGGDLLVGGTSTSTIPALNKGIYLQSATNNDVIGYSVRIDDGVNVRRGSMFLDDANGVFGWDVTASSGVPEYVWRTAGQERARITSVGAFLVGTTSTNGAFSLNTNTETWAAWLQQAHTTTGRSLVRLQYNVATPNVATDYFLYCDDATAVRANIRSNGGLANYQSNNVDLSDARTKKDITPAPSYWSKIGALEIVTYKYKDQTHDDINVGVIAQQVEQVEPVWVDTEGFGEVPEGEEPLKTVYTKDITFAAIKALQEAMFRIEALEAKVAALETH